MKKAYILASLTILFWSTAATAFKIGLNQTNYISLLFYSILTAVVVLLGIVLFQGKFNQLRSYSTADYFKSAVVGFLNPFLYYTILFKAYTLLPAQIAQPLNFVWPITLVLLSIPILKQPITGKVFIAMLISFTGVFFISSQGNILNFNLSSPLGIALALSSSVVWALFWIFNMKDKRDEVVKLFLNFSFALLFIFIYAVFNKVSFSMNNTATFSAIYIGIFEMGVTFVIWLLALQAAGRPEKIGTLIYLTPFCSLLFIHFILKEKIFTTTLIGLFLIITGIILQNYKKKKSYENQI
ncbi:MAG: DMT family transporter [Bacteroidales bacterium]|jgi:drug/metabolite transporter (DMT)-like permease|nr:DMT family transporter [Bacteroidales bacterium]